MRFAEMLQMPLVIVLALFSGLAVAHGSDAHHHSQQPHVHGQGIITVVREGELLQVELVAPAGDVVGFERAPASDEEKRHVRDALALLEDPGAIIRAEGGTCRLVEVSALSPEDSLGHHDNHSGGDGHDRGHWDVRVTHSFQCSRGERLRYLEVGVFAQFPDFERITVQWVVDGAQGQKVTTPGDRRIRMP